MTVGQVWSGGNAYRGYYDYYSYRHLYFPSFCVWTLRELRCSIETHGIGVLPCREWQSSGSYCWIKTEHFPHVTADSCELGPNNQGFPNQRHTT